MSQSEIQERAQQPAAEQQGIVRTYTRWQLFFLERMHRLCRIRSELEQYDVEEFQTKALKRAIFSTMLDCEAAGVGDEAKRMMTEIS